MDRECKPREARRGLRIFFAIGLVFSFAGFVMIIGSQISGTQPQMVGALRRGGFVACFIGIQNQLTALVVAVLTVMAKLDRLD